MDLSRSKLYRLTEARLHLARYVFACNCFLYYSRRLHLGEKSRLDLSKKEKKKKKKMMSKLLVCSSWLRNGNYFNDLALLHDSIHPACNN